MEGVLYLGCYCSDLFLFFKVISELKGIFYKGFFTCFIWVSKPATMVIDGVISSDTSKKASLSTSLLYSSMYPLEFSALSLTTNIFAKNPLKKKIP